MSFREFTLEQVEAKFAVVASEDRALFADVPAVPLSPFLTEYFAGYGSLGQAAASEKGRSELLVAPLLAEVWLRSDHRVSLLSGAEFNVDAAVGLDGVCDFLLCRSPNFNYVKAPILAAAEAKRDNIAEGLGQCAAVMIAAQRFNRKAGIADETVYGCVTTGSGWRFLRLAGANLAVDLREYSIRVPEEILGVLLHCCGVVPTAA